MAVLTEKTYTCVGQACKMLSTVVLLQVRQADLLHRAVSGVTEEDETLTTSTGSRTSLWLIKFRAQVQ